MADCQIAELKGRGVLKVSGADAKTFLQDVVTNDVTRAVDGRAVHAALLTPQGKILFDFMLLGRDDHTLLECGRVAIPDLVKRLTFYRLRAAVEFEDLSDRHRVWAAWGGKPDPGREVIVYADPRLDALGHRLIAPAGMDMAGACERASEDDYHRHRIANGVPESGKDYPLGDTFPHEADYDQLSGVDFKKGCYVGQEVVGRMQHRGMARKRIVPVKGTPPLEQGIGISAGNTSIGTMGSVSDEIGLAMVRLDRAGKAIADGQSLMAGHTEITLLQPAWANFEVPTRSGAA